MKRKAFSRRQMLEKSMALLAGAPALQAILTQGVQGATPTPTPTAAGPAAIATPQPEAVKAALSILKQGGNAVDAAVAALMTVCVVQPGAVGFGGYGGSMMVYMARQNKLKAIDFDSRCPRAFRPELYANPKCAERGYLATGVPGVVAGMDLALRSYGTLGWKTVSAHAADLAENGYLLQPAQQKSLEALFKVMDPASRKAYFPGGTVPAAGQPWAQKDLARLVRGLGESGARAFYEGEIAKAIVAQVKANGGILCEEDLKSYQAQESDPISVSYRGHDLYTPTPPSAGLTALSILKTLENFDLDPAHPWSAHYFHLLAEAAKLCWKERFEHFGDPESIKIPMQELLSKELAAKRAERIRTGKIEQMKVPEPEAMHTANITVIDKDHNCVSVTATHGGGFGSKVCIGGLGLVLGHGMSRFTYEKESPNYPAPGKRMQHNMSPMLILRQGKPWCALGMPGGRMIVTVTAQLVVDMIDFKTTPTQAVTAPRLHTEGAEPLLVTQKIAESVAAEMEKQGHRLKKVGGVGGAANVACIDADGTHMQAGSSAGADSVAVI